MKYKNYSAVGFVIGRKKYGEADRILILFTKTHGKISVIAKGVRKLTSRKRGGIEIFSEIKFSAINSSSLDILTEVEVINTYDRIRADLRLLSVAYYFCEVVGKVTQEEEKHDMVYEIMQKYFNEITKTKNLKKLRTEFVREILVVLGFWPHDKPMVNPDMILESVTERKINSFRVGRKMLQKD